MSNVDVVLICKKIYIPGYITFNLNIASETGLTSTNATQIHLLRIIYCKIYIYIHKYLYKIYT